MANNLHELIQSALDHLNEFDIDLISDLEQSIESGIPDADQTDYEVNAILINQHEAYLYAVMGIAEDAGILDDFPFDKADDKLFDLWEQYCALNGFENREDRNFAYKLFAS